MAMREHEKSRNEDTLRTSLRLVKLQQTDVDEFCKLRNALLGAMSALEKHLMKDRLINDLRSVTRIMNCIDDMI